jgi:steroid 5-alpha reductase family enzyme
MKGTNVELQRNKNVKQFLSFLVVANTAIFLIMACFHLLSTDAKSAVFIDFWGRFTVYSLWFIGFAVYLKYTSNNKIARWIVIFLICINIPLFLLLAYFDKISNTPDTIAIVDFWGRITVYSLWFICYEAYRKYVE